MVGAFRCHQRALNWSWPSRGFSMASQLRIPAPAKRPETDHGFGRLFLGLSCCIALILAFPVFLHAQRIRAATRQTVAGTPVVGAVVSLLDSSGRALVRTISDSTGGFDLPWLEKAARIEA